MNEVTRENGETLKVGDRVRVTGGLAFGRTGVIYKFYKVDWQLTVAVTHGEKDIGMYNLDEIEKV